MHASPWQPLDRETFRVLIELALSNEIINGSLGFYTPASSIARSLYLSRTTYVRAGAFKDDTRTVSTMNLIKAAWAMQMHRKLRSFDTDVRIIRKRQTCTFVHAISVIIHWSC